MDIFLATRIFANKHFFCYITLKWAGDENEQKVSSFVTLRRPAMTRYFTVVPYRSLVVMTSGGVYALVCAVLYDHMRALLTV